MNHVYKLVKGKVCSEFAKGAKKGQVGAVVLALMSFANVAQAEVAIDPLTQYQQANDLKNTQQDQLIVVNKATADAQYAELVSKNTNQDLVTAQNKAAATEQNAVTNKRIDETNSTVSTNDLASQQRDTQLQNTVNTNKATADAQNTATNQRIDATNTLLGDTVNRVSIVEGTVASQGNIINTVLAGNSNTTTTGTVTLGADIATNNATNSVVIGNKASTAKDNATVVGANAFNGGANGVVVGRNASSTGNNSIVLGTDASGTGNDVVALGSKASVTGNGSVAIGYGSVANSNNSVALGRGSTTNGRDNTVSVGYDGNDRAITHVAAGVQANDAVNVSQLNSLGSELGYRVTKLDKDLSGGIASAVAMGMMPTLSEPGRMITGGTGFYNGESAAAIGLTGTLENKKITYKMGATIVSNGDNSFGAGFGYRF